MSAPDYQEGAIRRGVRFLALPWLVPTQDEFFRQWHPARAALLSLALVAAVALPVAISSAWIQSSVFFFGEGARVTPLFGEAVLTWFVRMVAPYPIWLGLMYLLHRLLAPALAARTSIALSVSSRFGLAYILAYELPVGGSWTVAAMLVAVYQGSGPVAQIYPAMLPWHIWRPALIAAGLGLVGLGLWRHARAAREFPVKNEFRGHP